MKNEFGLERVEECMLAFFCCVRRYWLLMNSNISFDIFFVEHRGVLRECQLQNLSKFISPHFTTVKRVNDWKPENSNSPQFRARFFLPFSAHSLDCSANKWNNIPQLMSWRKGNEEKTFKFHLF